MAKFSEFNGSTWNTALRPFRFLTLFFVAISVPFPVLLATGTLEPEVGFWRASWLLFCAFMTNINQLDRLASRPKIDSPTADSESAGGRVLTDPVHARATFVKAQMGPFVNSVTLRQLLMYFAVFFYEWVGISFTVTMVLCIVSIVLILATFPRTSAWQLAAEKRFDAVFPEEG